MRTIVLIALLIALNHYYRMEFQILLIHALVVATRLLILMNLQRKRERRHKTTQRKT